VPSYVNTVGRLEVTVHFEKWAVYLQGTFVVSEVFRVSRNVCLKVRHSCHASRVLVCTYHGFYCFCLDLRVVHFRSLSVIYASLAVLM
jgi:hypothetical protein